MSDHVKGLEPKIHRLDDGMKSLVAADRTAALLKIIRQPGFTTVQELALIHAMLDHMINQVEATGVAHAALMAAAEKIGQ